VERREDRELRELDRNITSLCSSLDISTVYRPPSSLQLPVESLGVKGKGSGSPSGSGSESESSDSGAEDAPASRRSSGDKEKESTDVTDAHAPSAAHVKSRRQTSFGSGSILGQIASQAKELVKETKRQSSQEGLLSTVDKVDALLK